MVNFDNYMIKGLSLLGKTNSEIAQSLGIQADTLRKYAGKKQTKEALKYGGNQSAAELIVAAYKMGIGYSYTETNPIKLKKVYYDDRGKKVEEERIELTTVTKTVSPSPNVTMFLLKNRLPGLFSDMQVEREINIYHCVSRSEDVEDKSLPNASENSKQ